MVYLDHTLNGRTELCIWFASASRDRRVCAQCFSGCVPAKIEATVIQHQFARVSQSTFQYRKKESSADESTKDA